MSRLPDAFHQDKALRDAALGVIKADIEHARATMNGKAVAGRVAGRIGDGAKDVAEVAKVHAKDKQTVLAGLIALIALWLAREPIAEILGLASEALEEPEPESSEDAHELETAPAACEAEAEDENAASDLETLTTGDTP